MKELETALKLRQKGKLNESNEILKNLSKEYSNSSVINYQCAWSFDAIGLERDAKYYYEKAIDLGLSGEDLRGALLGLGSTYRTIG